MAEPHLARLGAWAADMRLAVIPKDTLRAARYQVLDMIAAAHAAGGSAECHEVDAGVAAVAGQGGRSTVIATGRKLPPVDAVVVNAAYSMAHDFDDIIWTGHTCHSAVFAPLAVAEHEGASTEDFLVAVVVANEVAGRLASSSYLGPLNGQMVSYIHLVGAAAGTARLLGLDGERTTHALAISLAQPNFALQPGFFRPTSKLLTAATPAATGIRAAYFARAGMTGAPETLEDPRGFWKRFSFAPLPAMLEGLGEFWALQTLGIKTFPGCYYFQTACSALQQIQRKRALTLDGVESVLVETTKLGVEVTRFAAEYAGEDAITPVNVDFDLRLAAAILLHAGRFTAHEHDAGWLKENAAALTAWRARIEVRHDPALTARVIEGGSGVRAGRDALRSLSALDIARLVRRYRNEYRSSLLSADEAWRWLRVAVARRRAKRVPGEKTAEQQGAASAVPLYFPGRVTVRLRGGATEIAQVDLPVGSFSAPSVEEELRQKFVRECAPLLGEEASERVFGAALSMESIPLPTLVRLFSGSPAPS